MKQDKKYVSNKTVGNSSKVFGPNVPVETGEKIDKEIVASSDNLTKFDDIEWSRDKDESQTEKIQDGLKLINLVKRYPQWDMNVAIIMLRMLNFFSSKQFLPKSYKFWKEMNNSQKLVCMKTLDDLHNHPKVFSLRKLIISLTLIHNM